MKPYLEFLDKIMRYGESKQDRTGTGTLSIFGHQMRFNLQDGFPLVTTKKVHLKSIIHELLWFIAGETNIEYLNNNGVTIWDEWADPDGNLGPIYGKQWRNWNGIDQLATVILDLKTNPDSRRHIVCSWNVDELDAMALPPCHCLFQFYVSNEGLSCQLYQRSADAFLGVPFNIASYALLTMMVAQVVGLPAYELIWTGGDCHFYRNHIAQVQIQLARECRPLPQMLLNPEVCDINQFRYEDFALAGYDPHPILRGKVAV